MYPLRGDSLSFFSQLYARKAAELLNDSKRGRALARALRARGISAADDLWIRPAQAEQLMAARVGVVPERGTAASPTVAEERAAQMVRWLPSGHFAEIYYPYWDWDEPPFFKSFLRVDVTEEEIRIRCFAATGCAEHESDPPLEDEVRWSPAHGWATC